MNGSEWLVLLSNATSVLQGIAAMSKSYDEVATIISKRIADGRLDWSVDERNKIMNALAKARADAVDAVNKLP